VRGSVHDAALGLAVGLASLFVGAPVDAAHKQPAADARRCFTADAAANRRATRALFERRDLQGGGPTWSAILEAVVKGYTTFVRASDGYVAGMPHFGTGTIVTFRGRQTWYLLDEEGDAATFCAGDKQLLAQVRADYDRLNGDARALEQALDRIGSTIE
jgi:hypothetical protein